MYAGGPRYRASPCHETCLYLAMWASDAHLPAGRAIPSSTHLVRSISGTSGGRSGVHCSERRTCICLDQVFELPSAHTRAHHFGPCSLLCIYLA